MQNIDIHDGLLEDATQRAIFNFLMEPGWRFGGQSNRGSTLCRYWAKHFAGYLWSDREVHDFEAELQKAAPLVFDVWKMLQSGVLKNHSLTRCYANGYPYGSEGEVHTDADKDDHFTGIYYPCLSWNPNFGGETVFFNEDRSDIIKSVYPKPNRFLTFPGKVPHVARPISAKCPQLRITLMFKTKVSR